MPPTAGLALRWGDLLAPSGPPDLAAAVAAWLGLPGVQVECSGTAALLVALLSLKRMSRRRTVVVPAYTCPLVALAIARAGLCLRVCDTVPERFDPDPEALARACDEDTLCIVPAHLGGLAADLAPVLAVARDAGAFVVEDAAQALGSTWQGRPVGGVGDIGFYSLAAGKGLTLYEGGLLAARDPDVRQALAGISREVIPSNLARETIRCLQLVGYRLAYHPVGLRLSYGLALRYWLARGEVERAIGDRFPPGIPLHRVGRWRRRVGAAAFGRLPQAVAEAAERGRHRAARLASVPGVTVIAEHPGDTGTWPFIMVLLPTAHGAELALGQLWRAGLGITRLFAQALPDYSYLRSVVPPAAVPQARAWIGRCITVTNSPWLSEVDFAHVCQVLERAARAR